MTYHALFSRSPFIFPGSVLLSLGLPWTRTMNGGGAWPTLLVSFAINAAMLYFIGSRVERLARENRP